MFDMQDNIIFDKLKKEYGLTYYDDTYETQERDFSYTIWVINNDGPKVVEMDGMVFTITPVPIKNPCPPILINK